MLSQRIRKHKPIKMNITSNLEGLLFKENVKIFEINF